MKTFTTKAIVILIAVFCLVGVTNAQRRYGHLPRVKVDAVKPDYSKSNKKSDNSTSVDVVSTTLKTINIEKQEANIPMDLHSPEITVASNDEADIKVINNKPVSKTSTTNTDVTQVNKRKLDNYEFTDKLSDNSKLLKIKDIKKSKIQISILLYIIFYILALVFLVLMLIYLLVIYNFTLFIVFMILAIVFALAASIILFLGRAGVF